MSNIVMYQNEELRRYVAEICRDNHIVAERDFVQNIRDYGKTTYEKAMLVTGLRSTGKTVGILQAAVSMENAVYICPLYKDSVDGSTIKQLLLNTDYRFIAIAEYSWISDNTELSEYLAGVLKLGVRVVITGTESCNIRMLQYAQLVHRAFEVHTTYFSYIEFCRIFGLTRNESSLSKYLAEGGFFGISLDSDTVITQYVKSAVLDDICNLYPAWNSEQVRLIVYTIFYDCICSSREIDNGKVAPIYGYSRALPYDDFLERFGIRGDLSIDPSIFKEISTQLEQIGVIAQVENLRFTSQFRTYIMNPALTYYLIQAIYHEDALATPHVGYMFEAAVVGYAAMNKCEAMSLKYAYFRRSGIETEIDFVLIAGKDAWLFECKHNANDDYMLSDRASIVRNDIVDLLGNWDIDVRGRYVIYAGKNKSACIAGHHVIYTNDWDVVVTPYKQFDISDRPIESKVF